MTDTTDTTFTGPVFGEGELDTRQFALVVHGPDDGPAGHREVFTAHAEIDAGAMIRVMSSGSTAQQAAATARLLMNACVDDDGLPLAYDVPRYDEASDEVLRGDVQAGDADPEHDDYDDRYDDRGKWSSRRRFAAILDDPRIFVKQTALEELSRYLIGEGGGRPTGKSGGSSSGRNRTGRGSGVRRS